MITSAILIVIFYILGFFIGLLPVGSLPSQVSSGFSSVIGYMYTINGFFPVDTLIYLATLAIAIQVFVFLWNAGHMILKYVRGN